MRTCFLRLTTIEAFEVWVIASLFCLVTAVPGVSAGLTPANLLCEYRSNPQGIDERQPRLSWRVDSSERGQKQTAWQILAATSPALLREGKADLWDSGPVPGDRTLNVPYRGRPLESRQRCYWVVRVWDAAGKPSTWSKPAVWTMGLLDPAEWKAEYISYRDTTPVHKDTSTLFTPPARQYRKQFEARSSVRRATIYATALGIYELHLNGSRVGDALFAPGWTDYRQRAYYHTYDVTPLVRKGANALGAWVADGWYSGYLGFALLTGVGVEKAGRYSYGKTPAFMAQLELEYSDGTREVVGTDRSWKVTGSGPIREADFLMGEFYDARQETPDWAKPGYDDSGWESAVLASDNGAVPATFYEFVNPAEPGKGPEVKGRPIDLGFKRPPLLQAFPGMPVRPTQEIKPVGLSSPANGVYIFNLGQNIAGFVRLKVRGPAGTVIRLRHGEMLHPDGRLMTENLRKARAIDHYVLRGDKRGEVWSPRFTFHGFQYVEVTGYPGKPDLDAITGIVVHSDTPLTSSFECSDPVINRLFKNIVWTQRANFIDLPTDCPQRDERFGWTGDAQVYVRAATYNADVAAFYTKWLRELMESQRPSGTFPGYAPFPFQHGWDFGTAWCDAGVICPWTIWRVYDDTRIIERCWTNMVKFMEWRQRTSRDFLGVAHGNEWGDWLAMGEKTPLEYIDTVYFAHTARLMGEMAEALGRDAEAARYRELSAKVKSAFIAKYVRPDGSLGIDSQTAYALALYMDLIPAELKAKACQILAARIKAKAGPANSGITTGFLGTRPLLPVLSQNGQHELALELFQSRKFPSWGYEVEQGATTIWERWNSYTRENGFGGEQNASMNSFAHYAFGAVGEWMFFGLAGIDSGDLGYKRIVFRPGPPRAVRESSAGPTAPISWVNARYDSMRGRIESRWRITDRAFEMQARVPANTTALLYLPADEAASVTESGRSALTATGVRFLRMEGERAVFELQSGEYRFSVPAR